jgi:hypothetical protein
MLEYSQRARLIAHWYVGGTFFSAKGMTNNTKTPQLIMKAILYLSFGAIINLVVIEKAIQKIIHLMAYHHVQNLFIERQRI